jgi:hypothetical protein
MEAAGLAAKGADHGPGSLAGTGRRAHATKVLFHIEQVHSPQDCPYGQGGSRSLHDDTVEGVNLIAMYGAFMEHVIYLVAEADDLERLNLFLLPGMKRCTTRITPVSTHPLPVVTAGQQAG